MKDDHDVLIRALSEGKIEEFCQRWKIQELAVFGSILREDFDSASDVDVLVTFMDDARWGLFDHVQMERDLEELLKREVDLLSKRAVERSSNWLRRHEILNNARVVFSVDEVVYA